MTHFRGAKVFSKWLQGRIDDRNRRKSQSENSIFVCYTCVVKQHEYTNNTNYQMITMTFFHTKHIKTTCLCLVLFILCQRIVTSHTAPNGSSLSCVRHSSHPHALMMSAVLLRHWSLLSLHPLPLAPPVALLPLPHLEARRAHVHSAQKGYGLHWRDLLPHRLWAQRLRLQRDFCRVLHRAPDLAAVSLQQRVSQGRRVRWRCTRGYAAWSSPSTFPSLSTGRLVCRSVVVCVRKSGATCWGK